MDVVISDLDGTLLEHSSYSFEAALPALKLMDERRIPVVYCSSKTRREMEHWRRLTGNHHPFIVENGGAVVIPAAYFGAPPPGARVEPEYSVVELGDSYEDLTARLTEAAAESGCQVRAFHRMSAAEIAGAAGLDADIAVLAKARQFDEPFLILDKERQAELLAAIERAGKHWTRGGRFFHILGNNDKAGAVAVLLAAYRRDGQEVRSIGIGDGLNDAPFLNAVDVPVLIRTPWLEKLQALVPRGVPTKLPGPRGWNEAMLRLFG